MRLARTVSHELGLAPMPPPSSMVFVVDDDISVRESLELLFQNEGWQAKTFESAQEFLDYRRALIPSCLILDVMMPGMTGLDLQQELTRRGREIPVIFITARKDEALRARAFKQGAVKFLNKPFSDTALLEALNLALPGN